MKYYGFITNSLGERVLFTEALSRIEVETELNALIAAGFPKERTKILRAGLGKGNPQHAFINFVTAEGEVYEYSIHSMDIRHEFLVAAEMICRRNFTRIVAAELCDFRHVSLCKVQLGDIYIPGLRHDHRPLQTNTLERYFDKQPFSKRF